MVICSRYVTGTAPAVSRRYQAYQRIYRGAIRILLGREITDSTNGFRAFDRVFVQAIGLSSNRFSVCPEMTFKATLAGGDVGYLAGPAAARGRARARRSSSSRTRSPATRASWRAPRSTGSGSTGSERPIDDESDRKLAIILGIRPDLIRASLILRRLQTEARDDVVFIWSGQHYSDNLKDVFLRELDIQPPDIELGAVGETDAEVVGDVVSKLYPVLAELRPAAAVFLGDTNTVMGSIAAGLLNIPGRAHRGCDALVRLAHARGEVPDGHRPPGRRDLHLLRRVQGAGRRRRAQPAQRRRRPEPHRRRARPLLLRAHSSTSRTWSRGRSSPTAASSAASTSS